MHIQEFISVLFACTLTLCTSTDHSDVKSSVKISESFLDTETTIFNHLAVDKYGKWVYIGAENHLYQLSSDLSLQIKFTLDELKPPNCTSDKCPNKLQRDSRLDNYNHVLVLDYQNQQLVSCSTFFEGICHAHNISDISKILTTKFEKVVESGSFSSHVAFIAPSSENNSSIPSSQLYVGIIDQSRLSKIIIRNLQRNDFLSVPGPNSTFGLRTGQFEYNPRFICGFTLGNSDYFLTSEIRPIRPGYSYIITGHTDEPGHLIKMDHKDEKYSYDDVFLICDTLDEKYYSKVSLEIRHAYIYNHEHKSNFESRTASDSHDTQEKTLFAVFDVTIGNDRYVRRRVGFIVCKYDTKKINSPDPKNSKVQGDLVFLHEGNTKVTAMAVTSVENHTVMFFGTDNGHLQKVSVKGFNSPKVGSVNYHPDTIIDEGSLVNSDMLFDSKENFLYVMTEKKLVKVKIHNCDQYNTSYTCLAARDPFCGWCFPSNTCSLKTECTDGQNNTKWMSYDIYKHINTSSNIGNEFTRRIDWNTTNSLIQSHPPLNSTMICRSYSTCIPCVTSTIYPCKWHQNEHRCTDETTWTINDTVIGANLDQFYSTNPKNGLDNKYPRDPFYCPQFYTYDPYRDPVWPDFYDDEPNIYIDVHNKETVKNITVKYRIPIDFTNETFSCEFDIEGNKTIKSATAQIDNTFYAGYVEGQIICDNMTFAYIEKKSNVTVELSVLQNGSIPLDNPLNTNVVLYKCGYVGNNCKTCVQLKYCKWNTEMRVCEYDSINHSKKGKKGKLEQCRD